VLEGYVNLNEMAGRRARSAIHTGFYSLEGEFSVFPCGSGVTHKKETNLPHERWWGPPARRGRFFTWGMRWERVFLAGGLKMQVSGKLGDVAMPG